MDNNVLVGAVLTGLSKAFDWISHNLLIAKLSPYNFSDKALSYIYSYLTNHRHCVRINNTQSAQDYNFGCSTGIHFGADSFQPINK